MPDGRLGSLLRHWDPHTLQWIMQSPRKEIGECRFSRDATYH